MPEKEWMVTDNLNFNSAHDKIMYLTHVEAYNRIYNLVENLNVLEVGCGSGYGSKYLAQNAKSITTVDIDNKSLEFAQKNNFAENIKYINANATERLPFDDNTFDMAISFQVIEHISPKLMNNYLNEFKRLVKNRGLIIFTTPNRKIRLQNFQKPRNPYHIEEYSEKTLRKILIKHFKEVTIEGLHATDDIINMKLQMKQTFFQAYLRNPIRDFILKTSKNLNIKIISNLLENRSKTSINKDNDTKLNLNYSTKNFWFDTKDVDMSIDLLAICKK